MACPAVVVPPRAVLACQLDGSTAAQHIVESTCLIRGYFCAFSAIPFFAPTAGYAFVYMKYKDDGNYAIRKLDGQEFGYKRRRLRVEWSNVSELAFVARSLGLGSVYLLLGVSRAVGQ